MARTSSKKRSSKRASSAKYDVIIKAKATTTRIVDINKELVSFECNNKGQVNGKYYSGVHWDTVGSTMLTDGGATLTIRYLHITNKGESIAGIGTGTQMPPNQRGIAKVNAEGTMWTSAPRLSNLNGGRWKVEGEVNIVKETGDIRGYFNPSNI
jgi:hypothetical protein